MDVPRMTGMILRIYPWMFKVDNVPRMTGMIR